MTDIPRIATISLPPWIYGWDPDKFIEFCGYKYRDKGSGQDGSRRVQTIEGYHGNKPDLVRTHTIADTGTPERYMDLATFPEHAATPTIDDLDSILEARRLHAEQQGDLLARILHESLLLHAISPDQLPAEAKRLREQLRAIELEGGSGERPFRSTGVHFLQVKKELLHRVKLAPLGLRLEQDPELSPPPQRGDRSAVDGRVFDSSTGLLSGTFIFDAYIGPLLAACSPGVWAFSVTRTSGIVLIHLGSIVSGTVGHAAELLQTVAIPGALSTVKFPRLSAAAGASAIHWWGDRLNECFGVLTDLALYATAGGHYAPAKHLEAMLTVEQVFRRTTSLMVAHRDTHGRRALFFTVMDSLESVTGISV